MGNLALIVRPLDFNIVNSHKLNHEVWMCTFDALILYEHIEELRFSEYSQT